MHAITMTLNRVIWEKFGIKKPPKNEDARQGLYGDLNQPGSATSTYSQSVFLCLWHF